MTKTETILALCEAATPGPWHHVQAFQTVGKLRTIHGAVPAQRVDFVSTEKEPVHKRVIIPMETRESHTTSNDMAFIAACNPAEIRRMVEGWEGAVDALKAVRADLLLRAEMDMEDGGAILNISNGVLRKLDEAIAAFDAWQGGEE